jgi:hypothetical protein
MARSEAEDGWDGLHIIANILSKKLRKVDKGLFSSLRVWKAGQKLFSTKNCRLRSAKQDGGFGRISGIV